MKDCTLQKKVPKTPVEKIKKLKLTKWILQLTMVGIVPLNQDWTMDFSTGMSYLQNQIQHKKLEQDCEARFSVH